MSGKKLLLILGVLTVIVGVVMAFNSIYITPQQVGILTPTCIIYTFAITEHYGINASNYVFPIAIANTDPGFSYLLQKNIYVAADSKGNTPLDYWVFEKNQSEIEMWIKVPTISSSQVTKIYVFGCPVNKYPDEGNPASNKMFIYYNNFTGGEQPMTPTYMGIENSTKIGTSTVGNGILQISGRLSYGDDIAFRFTSINLSSHPYVIHLARISISQGNGALFGLYVGADDGFETDVVLNAYLISSSTTSNGFYIVTYHSDWFGPSFGGYQYYSTQNNSWFWIAEWLFYDSYYTTVYVAAYDDYGALLSVDSTTVTNYTEIATLGLGILQIHSDNVGQDFTAYVDWVVDIDYSGWPYYTIVGLGYLMTKRE